ncbi:MAG TPA: glucokinase, partial [Chloroflexota bacterium]
MAERPTNPLLLAADIGGTKTDMAVFSAELGARAPIAEKRFPSADYPSLEAIATEFLSKLDLPVSSACFAVAGPVVEDRAALTNLPWVVETSTLRSALGLGSVKLLNDLEAMATAVPYLLPRELHTVQEGVSEPGGTLAVIAPGTGLGEAFLTWDGGRYHAHASEGGHTNFGPTTPREIDLLRFLQDRWGSVSYERVCAGQSIPDLYDFLRSRSGFSESPGLHAELQAAHDRTPPIMAAGLNADAPDPLSQATLDLFTTMLGKEAGNLALTVLATAGVYLAGGIVQRMAPSRGWSQFQATFCDKGRLSGLLQKIPVFVILEPVA